MRAHNQKRMQQYDHTREECFLANEKPGLLPLPKDDYEVKRVHELTVADSCMVYLSTYKTYYSVPYQWVGSKVKVVVTRTLVKIYSRGECVATHLRNDRSKWVYEDSHFPPKSQQWRGRSRQWFIDRGSAMSPALGSFITAVFDNCGTVEQAMYKTCDAILHLARETDPGILRQAIEQAEALGKYNYRLLSSLIKSLKAGIVPTETQTSEASRLSPPPSHAGLRGKAAFK